MRYIVMKCIYLSRNNINTVSLHKTIILNNLHLFFSFRLGKVYKFDLQKTDIKSFVSFAEDWYKHSKMENVPLEVSPL